jgi:hypothetical protein
MEAVSSQLGLQLRKNGSELLRRGRLLRPLDDEALLIRVGWLRDNVEVNVVHKLSPAQSTVIDVSCGHPHIESFIRT